MNYTGDEVQAVKYYIGDVRNLPQDDFWNDPKAYCMLNSLFYSGITTESARIAEGKYLNPEILTDISRLTVLLQNLFSVFRKSAAGKVYQTYRVERFSDYQDMHRQNRTVSFTSTSENGFLKAYQDRSGIALLKFVIPQGTPCIIMRDFFQDYAKPEEAEILLPPDLKLHFADLPLTEQEKQISDVEGRPPMISCLVTIQGVCVHEQACSAEPEANGNLAGKRVLQAIQSGNIPHAEDVLHYTEWKTYFIKQLLKNAF